MQSSEVETRNVRVRDAHLAFFVSSAICPEASKPVNVPAVKRLEDMRQGMLKRRDPLTNTKSSSNLQGLPFRCLWLI